MWEDYYNINPQMIMQLDRNFRQYEYKTLHCLTRSLRGWTKSSLRRKNFETRLLYEFFAPPPHAPVELFLKYLTFPPQISFKPTSSSMNTVFLTYVDAIPQLELCIYGECVEPICISGSSKQIIIWKKFTTMGRCRKS